MVTKGRVNKLASRNLWSWKTTVLWFVWSNFEITFVRTRKSFDHHSILYFLASNWSMPKLFWGKTFIFSFNSTQLHRNCNKHGFGINTIMKIPRAFSQQFSRKKRWKIFGVSIHGFRKKLLVHCILDWTRTSIWNCK